MKSPQFLFLLFFLVSGYQISAQIDFLPGVIVTRSKDTLSGHILFETDKLMADGITFKPNLKSTGKTYKPTELLNVRFDNGRYFEVADFDSKNIEQSPKLLKRVLEGKVNVYVHRVSGQSKPNIYLKNRESGKTAYLIYPKSELLTKENKNFKYQDKRYLGQIKLIKESGDDSFEEDLKYSENKIVRNLKDYNDKFQEEFLVAGYKEEVEFSYDITAGFAGTEGDYAFRLSAYRNKQEIEKTKKLYIIRGVSLVGWADKNREVDVRNNGTSNFQRYVLSLVPWGVKYRTNIGSIQPYAYIAPALAIIYDKHYKIEDGENTGTENSVFAYPSLNMGAGLRFKAGNNYILAEITPSLDHSVFLNVGYSF